MCPARFRCYSPETDPAGNVVGAECEIELDEIRLVTVADEGEIEAPMRWYFAPTDDGGGWHWIVRVDESGAIVDRSGGSGACEFGRTLDDDGLWLTGGGGSETEVAHIGHAPEGTATVRLYFGDNEPVEVGVNRGGYFLAVLPHSACCTWSGPSEIEALDAAENVIGELGP